MTVLGLLLVRNAAAAAPAASPVQEPTPEELEPPPRVPLAAYVYETPGIDGDLAQRLEGAVLAALRGHRRLALIDNRDLLDPAEAGLVALSKVQELLEQARQLMDGKKSAQSEKVLEQAQGILLRELGHVGRPEDLAETLREALGLQASAAFVQGDRPRALQLLQAVHNVNRKLRFVSRLFPDSMKDFVEEARQQFLSAQRGALSLGASPAGALIYLGGVKAGQGRAVLEGLPPGPHYVTWVRRYRRAVTMRVVVEAGKTTELSPMLPRYGDSDPIARLEAGEAQLGRGEMPLPLVEGAAGLRADLLLLVRPQAPDKGTLRLSAYLYDRRLRTLLREAQQAVALDALDRDVSRLCAALLQDAKLDGRPKVAERPAAAAPPPPPPNAFDRAVRSKWFWPVLGAVAGAVVAGAVVDVAVRGK